jgi:hypothetical protein
MKDKYWKAVESIFKHDQEVLMPGFRFHLTEEELVEFYLRRKVEGQHFDFELIAHERSTGGKPLSRGFHCNLSYFVSH